MPFNYVSVLLTLLLAPLTVFAQTSADWKQHVAYEIDVTLDAANHQMDGVQRLTYVNNSPDTLRKVFYHLYFNAFNPTSMMAERNRHLPDPDDRVVPRIFNLGPDEVGYHRVEQLTQDGQALDFDITDTVMRVELAEPIPPGGQAVFEMTFRSQVPLQTRRSGRDNREGIDFSMSQWYPKIAEYDERGWHANPYVGREFYAPYGSFDVEITLPAEYTIGATGVLQNPAEIGHGYDTSGNGSYRPDNTSEASGDSLTWHFRADNVHDFAWAADPDYIHDHIVGPGGLSYHLLYQPNVADNWQYMRQWVPQLVQFYSREYGPYAYPQFTVAQAGDGGMEYPMNIFITGRRSPRSLLGVTAHEAAHEWFYAALGSNETDYAWMDEGFTSYAATEGMAHVAGQQEGNHLGARLNFLYLHDRGLFERINTPADWFTTNAAYGIASYPTGEMVVDMLGYVISDSLRDAWLQEYYRRFTFRHPNPYDLEKIAEDVSGLRLDWYFEQFTNTTRTLDYAVEDLDVEQAGDAWRTDVTLARESEVAMPVDLKLTYADGRAQWVTIPLGIMQGHKPVSDDWIAAEPWLWTFPEYTFTADLPGRVVSAEIDPDGSMPDANRLNNTSSFPLETRFVQPPGQSWFDYRVGWRPLAQYAHDFGFGAGLQARGQYLFGRHRLRAMLKLWPQVLLSDGEKPELAEVDEGFPLTSQLPDLQYSFFDGIDYELNYTSEIAAFGQEATAVLSARKHLGILENRVTLEKPLAAYDSDASEVLTLALVHQLNPTDRAFSNEALNLRYPTGEPAGHYPLNSFRRMHMLSARAGFRVEDGPNLFSASIEAGSSLRSTDQGSFNDQDRLRSATHFELNARTGLNLDPLTSRLRFRFGVGAEDLAIHKRFRLGAASLEERWRHDAFRSVTAGFENPLDEVHLVALRGPGPVAYLPNSASLFVPSIGSRLLSFGLSIQTPPPDNLWFRPLRFELFSGAGTVWSQGGFFDKITDADDYLADAGLGVSYDVSALRPLERFVQQSDVLSGLKITAKFPFWASDPEVIEDGQNELAFRWLVGIETGL